MAQNGQVLVGISLAHAAVIFAESSVKLPVETVSEYAITLLLGLLGHAIKDEDHIFGRFSEN